MKDFLLRLALGHPRLVIAGAVLVTLGFALFFPRIRIDTDPENMLPEDEEVRVHHSEVKETFGLHDYLVVGVVREAEGGVFRPETLAKVAELTDAIRDMEGVLEDDILAPSEVDDIYTDEDGTLRVDILMEEPPDAEADAQRILVRIGKNPVLQGKLASEDGQAMALFVPLESKEVADEVASRIEAVLEEFTGDEEYHLAGIPLAEDTFGAQMFLQMAVTAPVAFLLIYLLMLFFFRKPRLVLAPMIVAMMSVLWAMGLLIGTGFTVHIMSSMIPIFLIPIAVLDSIHMLTEFHENYPKYRDKRKALRATVDELFVPMGFTTITTMVGFASLILTPIPPVQVFGAFVAFGIGTAWLLSMTFIVAYASLLPEKTLENFGFVEGKDPIGDRPMRFLQRLSVRFAKPIVAGGILILVVAVVGLFRIQVNDNPVKWFQDGHPLRVADAVMNEHLAGTYLAYLTLEVDEAEGFKDPATMKYVERLQQHLQSDPNVGATTSIADIVKKIRGELLDDEAEGFLPDSRDEIAQYLFLYEISGGDPEDLFKLITPENDRANVWVQMRQGENRDVARVVALAEEFLDENPRDGLTARWAGLPYINIVWQGKMVSGMGKALGGSFVIVLLMMAWLFRSLRLGLLSMIPLVSTILVVYGYIGWIGKPYDMPIAVLSALTLGLSIDFAIHFLQRARESFEKRGNLEEAFDDVFGAPARAIAKNIFVISLGFVPMFFATLVPYVTVSLFFFAIMIISGFTTIILLPAILSLMSPRFLQRGGANLKSNDMAPALGSRAAVLIIAAALLASPAAAQRQSPDAGAILDPTLLMKEAHLNMYYPAEDGRAVVEMELVDKRGKTRSRKFIMLRRDEEDGGKQKYFTYFVEPSDVRRTTFMVWKDPTEDDARWIYVPAIDLVKRISAKDKGSSFVGSDFSYEDVSGRPWTDDTHELLRMEEHEGRSAHVIKSVPKEKDSFAEKISWIGVEEKLPLREEYYDKKGKLVRVFSAERIEELDGHLTVSVRTMTNEKKSHKTTVTFTEVEYDIGVEEKVFSERHLKSPPTGLATP